MSILKPKFQSQKREGKLKNEKGSKKKKEKNI